MCNSFLLLKERQNLSHCFLAIIVCLALFRKDGTKATTRIRKVTGDRDIFLNELRISLDLPPPKNGNPRDDAIRIRTGGTIEVQGNRVREVKEWLAGLGF